MALRALRAKEGRKGLVSDLSFILYFGLRYMSYASRNWEGYPGLSFSIISARQNITIGLWKVGRMFKECDLRNYTAGSLRNWIINLIGLSEVRMIGWIKVDFESEYFQFVMQVGKSRASRHCAGVQYCSWPPRHDEVDQSYLRIDQLVLQEKGNDYSMIV